MSNNSNATANVTLAKSLLKTHYTLILISLGFMFNILTFIILCRPSYTGTYVRPSIHYTNAMTTYALLLLCKSHFDIFIL
jgi:hypothetical protein